MKTFLLIISLIVFAHFSWALRIVSLSPYLTEELILLNSEDSLVGVTNFSKNKFNLDKEVIGDTLNINIEKIVSLRPDIILVTPMNKMERVRKLEELGIEVKFFPPEKDFKDICRNFLELAKSVKKTDQAEAIIRDVENKLKKLEKLLKDKKYVNVFIEIGNRPLITAGSNCYLNDIIKYAKGKNVAENIGEGFFRVTKEIVLKFNPDIILILTMEKGKGVQDWKKFIFLKAVKNKNIFLVNTDILSRPNPEHFLKAVYILSKIFHPGVKFNED
jgi:iron complex transport system substrate-binding protein